MPSPPNWIFLDKDGTFSLHNPEETSSLYFPLVNHAGLMSCVTPNLHGDIKSGQDSFLTRPLSVEDLHESRAARNIWVSIEGFLPWSPNGCSAYQVANRFQASREDQSRLEAGFLWHRLLRQHSQSGLKAEITNFIPVSGDKVELLQISLTNSSSASLKLSVLFAVPIFGRSADHLRDHRHVTSLLNKVHVHTHGVIGQPTLVFDENGHHPNQTMYAVLGAFQDGSPPAQIFPLVDHYIGEGNTLDWPEAVVKKLPSPFTPGHTLKGYEALGGMRFPEVSLEKDQTINYIIILGIANQTGAVERWIDQYGGKDQFENWLKTTRQYWNNRLDSVRIETSDARRDAWTRWVSIQPIFRELYGNSFLPYHDYGRGGRGWRDLWQDILGLLLMRTEDVSQLLESHFAGVRFDGSNATIIGHKPGEFTADRNDIHRVWMDHGAWPLFTTHMYINWTGDLDILLRKQSYFKDHLTHRSQKVDSGWSEESGTELKTTRGEIYRGSIYEHLLIQNLVSFFNVGEHNCIRLEGADWNDALDMANQLGESVAFTAFYAGNLDTLANLAELLNKNGEKELALAGELRLLLDSIFDPIDYHDPAQKRQRLTSYLDSCAEHISGQQIHVKLTSLAEDLRRKADWMANHLRAREWIDFGDHGWFNGYYDNLGRRVEGKFNNTVQMTLAGQVFQLMFGIATDEQALAITESVQRYLYNPVLNGIRLNTQFKYRTDALGRIFGFAYGHKENGAMFSHMAVMYAYSLFKRQLPRQAHQLLEDLYQHCQNFPVSRMYPGIPEYLDPQGRGRYPYLTGSASWYMLTLITRIFGMEGLMGDLHVKPSLNNSWFNENGKASMQMPFAGRFLRVVFHKPSDLENQQLTPIRIESNGQNLPTSPLDGGLLIKREVISALPDREWQQLDVYFKNHEAPTDNE